MRIGGFDYIVECAEFNGIFKINLNRLFSTLASFNQTEIIKDKINDLLYEIFDKPLKIMKSLHQKTSTNIVTR